MSRNGSVKWRGAPLSLLLVGMAVLVVAVALQRGGPRGAGPGGSATPANGAGAGASGGGSGAIASAVASAHGRLLPQGLEDRGWIAEVAMQRWIAGSLTGRVLVLPSDETGLTATPASVVSVRYSGGGATSTLRVRDLMTGRLRVSVDRPGTIASAVIVGDTVYVTGDDGTGGTSDAGVQAISLIDGSVRDVIAPGPAPADAPGPMSRAQLRLSAAGTSIGAPLCAGDVCTIDVIDLATGARTTPIRNAPGSLLALTNGLLYLVDDLSSSVRAVDAASGAVRWTIADAQIAGLLPSRDGTRAVIAYLPNRAQAAPLTFTLANADATSGSLSVLLERPADAEVPSFFPDLSGDRYAVIGNGGSLSEVLGGIRRRIALTLVDARNGTTLPDAVTLTAP